MRRFSSPQNEVIRPPAHKKQSHDGFYLDRGTRRPKIRGNLAKSKSQLARVREMLNVRIGSLADYWTDSSLMSALERKADVQIADTGATSHISCLSASPRNGRDRCLRTAPSTPAHPQKWLVVSLDSLRRPTATRDDHQHSNRGEL